MFPREMRWKACGMKGKWETMKLQKPSVPGELGGPSRNYGEG